MFSGPTKKKLRKRFAGDPVVMCLADERPKKIITSTIKGDKQKGYKGKFYFACDNADPYKAVEVALIASPRSFDGGYSYAEVINNE